MRRAALVLPVLLLAACDGSSAGSQACQHGATYRKPGTSFELRNGKVCRIAIAADFD